MDEIKKKKNLSNKKKNTMEHYCNPKCFVFRIIVIFGIINSIILVVMFLITKIKHTIIFIL
jgi:hypothetical protein